MFENPVLESLVPQLVARMEEMLQKKYPFEYCLRMIMDSETVSASKPVHGDKEKLELEVRKGCQNNSLERARLSASSGKAFGFAGGRIPPRSGRDRAAGADVEDRRDALESDGPMQINRAS